MVPPILKGAFVPGTFTFFLLAITVGTLLLYRKRHDAGRLLLTGVMCLYWVLSTPGSRSRSSAGSRPITVQSRIPPRRVARPPSSFSAPEWTSIDRAATEVFAAREHALRALEAVARLSALQRPWVIVTGGWARSRTRGRSDGRTLMRSVCRRSHRARSRSREHARARGLVPPLLAASGVTQFVLVTSRQHMARALRVSPRPGLIRCRRVRRCTPVLARGTWSYLPSGAALEASTVDDVRARRRCCTTGSAAGPEVQRSLQRDRKHRAAGLAVLGPYAAAVQLDQMPHDRQSQSRAPGIARSRLIHAVEALEHACEIGLGQARGPGRRPSAGRDRLPTRAPSSMRPPSGE